MMSPWMQWRTPRKVKVCPIALPLMDFTAFELRTGMIYKPLPMPCPKPVPNLKNRPLLRSRPPSPKGFLKSLAPQVVMGKAGRNLRSLPVKGWDFPKKAFMYPMKCVPFLNNIKPNRSNPESNGTPPSPPGRPPTRRKRNYYMLVSTAKFPMTSWIMSKFFQRMLKWPPGPPVDK